MKNETDSKTTKSQPKSQPMSLRLPDDLKAELSAAAAQLGESETTVARMSIRHGIKSLLAAFENREQAAA